MAHRMTPATKYCVIDVYLNDKYGIKVGEKEPPTDVEEGDLATVVETEEAVIVRSSKLIFRGSQGSAL